MRPPRCPCGSQPDQATLTRGRTSPDGPLEPGRIELEPCGHVLEAFTPEFRAYSREVVAALAAEQPEGSDRK